jgi:formylglycine-generating enzyme required for sulfatase activity
MVFWHRSFQEYMAARAISALGDRKLCENAKRLLYGEEGREVLPLLAGRMMNVGADRLEDLFCDLSRDAMGKDALAQRARAFAVISQMLADVASTRFRLPADAAEALGRLRSSMRELFEKGKARDVDRKIRIEAAEALGAAHPGLRRPNDAAYWVPIRGGTFTMGAQKENPSDKLTYDPDAKDDEPVRRNVQVSSFQVGRHPVTVWEYEFFLEETRGVEAPVNWEEQRKHPARPVTHVSWHDAERYCQWCGCRLPTEEQWEFAARGEEGRRFPWGSEAPDETRAHFADRSGTPSPVGLFADGDTPDGVSGLAGNVWEWTRSEHKDWGMVVRGGSWDGVSRYLRAAGRYGYRPDVRFDYFGFRCVRE